MHTLHVLPKDLHICKLTAVNVVDVEEKSGEAETQKKKKGILDGRWKERDCFSYMIVPLNLNYRYVPTVHAS